MYQQEMVKILLKLFISYHQKGPKQGTNVTFTLVVTVAKKS